ASSLAARILSSDEETVIVWRSDRERFVGYGVGPRVERAVLRLHARGEASGDPWKALGRARYLAPRPADGAADLRRILPTIPPIEEVWHLDDPPAPGCPGALMSGPDAVEEQLEALLALEAPLLSLVAGLSLPSR